MNNYDKIIEKVHSSRTPACFIKYELLSSYKLEHL
jgi:hypothetical protein